MLTKFLRIRMIKEVHSKIKKPMMERVIGTLFEQRGNIPAENISTNIPMKDTP